jgi:hypothetical protein
MVDHTRGRYLRASERLVLNEIVIMTILFRTYISLALRHLPQVWSAMTILFRTYSSLTLRYVPRVWPTMTIWRYLRASERLVLNEIVIVDHTQGKCLRASEL